MGRIVEFLVALNAVGGVLTFLGIRWGVRRARGAMPSVSRDKPSDEGGKT